jgi:hypothetical protein
VAKDFVYVSKAERNLLMKRLERLALQLGWANPLVQTPLRQKDR